LGDYLDVLPAPGDEGIARRWEVGGAKEVGEAGKLWHQSNDCKTASLIEEQRFLLQLLVDRNDFAGGGSKLRAKVGTLEGGGGGGIAWEGRELPQKKRGCRLRANTWAAEKGRERCWSLGGGEGPGEKKD